MEISRISASDLKCHDRQLPPKPITQEKVLQEKQENRINNFQNRPQSREKKQLTEKYAKTKKESVSTDITSMKSVQVRTKSKDKPRKAQSQVKKTDKKKTGKKSRKTKLQKEMELLEQKRLVDLEEEKRLQEEDQRAQELALFRQKQEAKLTQEERERLNSQEEYKEQIIIQFESNVYFSAAKKREIQEWQRYITCISKPSPTNSHLDRTEYAESIVDELQEYYYNSKCDNKFDMMGQHKSFIHKIRDITQKKIEEMTAFIMKKQPNLVDEKNSELEQLDKILLSPENMSKIASKIQSKPEERYFYEIIKTFQKPEILNIAFSFNLLRKTGYRFKPIKFDNLNVSVDIPRTYQNSPSVFRYTFINHDFLSQNEFGEYQILGGVHSFDCYEAIPMPVRGRGWTLQRDYNNVKEVLRKIQYPNEKIQDQQQQLLSVQLQMDKNLYVSKNDKIQIAEFDLQTQQWTTENIQLENFDYENYTAKFKTYKLNHFAFVKPKISEFPYKSWVLRCTDSNKAFLDIETQRLSFKFEISEDYVILLNNGIKELEHLYDEELDGSQLLYQLQKLGINLLPSKFDSHPDIPPKENDVENKALFELILASRSFAVKSTKFNRQCENDQILFQIRENMQFEKSVRDTDEFEWKIVSCWCNKVAILKTKEKDTHLSLDLYSDTKSHSMLEILLSEHALIPEELLYRMRSLTCSDFQNNMRRFLKLAGVLTLT